MRSRNALCLLTLIGALITIAPGDALAVYRTGYVCSVELLPQAGQDTWASVAVTIYTQPRCAGTYVSEGYWQTPESATTSQHYDHDELLALYQALLLSAINKARVHWQEWSAGNFSSVRIDYF